MRLAVKSASCATPKCARSTLDYDDDDSTAPNFVDHFSLRQPSSTIKFRGARVHVYETSDEQILLEDRRSSGDFFGDDYDGDKRHPRRHNITVKRVSLSNFGVFILRMAYVVVSLFIFGLCLAFSFQIILSLFIQVAAGVNESISSNWDFFNFQLLGVLLSTPVFLFGFSSLMVLATTFVSEAWTGGHLIRAVIGAPSLVKEVLFFVAFILVPALTFIIALLIDSKNPWKVTCAAWVISVLLLFCSFAFAIVWCEIVACFRLLSIHYEDDEGGKPSFFSSVKRSILLIQRQRFAGRQSEQYLVTDDCVPPDGGFTFSDNHKPTDVKKGIYARITQLGFLSWFFDTVDPPTRLYSMEEVQDVMPFFTKYSWSLESVFCTGSRRRKIIAAKGPAALKPEQIMSSFACNVIGTSIIILTGVSYLLWVQRQNIRMILTFGILCIVICLYPLVKSYKDMFQMYKDMKDKEIKTIDHQMYKDMNKGTGKRLTMVDEETAEGPGDGVEEQQTGSVEGMSERIVLFRLWEEARVSQPKAWVCYTAMVWEFLFLILLPAIFLLNNQDFWSTAVFIVLGIFSFLRKYFDASAILCELGSMNTIDVEIDPGKPRRGRLFRQKTFKGVQKTLVLKSRLAEIVSNVSRGSAATGWACFFAVLIVGFFALSFLAVISEDGLGDRPPIVLLDDFAYPSEETLQYPTCSMRKGFDITTDSGATFDTKLADYAFLAAISYETTNVTDYLLPKWFTEGEVVDEDELVKQYRAETGTQNARVVSHISETKYFCSIPREFIHICSFDCKVFQILHICRLARRWCACNSRIANHV